MSERCGGLGLPQDGAIDELDDSRVMFGYVRCIMPDGRPKFVAIIWAGPAAAEQHKGKIQGYQRQIEDFLRPSHLKIMVSPYARLWIQPQATPVGFGSFGCVVLAGRCWAWPADLSCPFLVRTF